MRWSAEKFGEEIGDGVAVKKSLCGQIVVITTRRNIAVTDSLEKRGLMLKSKVSESISSLTRSTLIG